jgi:hypothetical protein
LLTFGAGFSGGEASAATGINSEYIYQATRHAPYNLLADEGEDEAS